MQSRPAQVLKKNNSGNKETEQLYIKINPVKDLSKVPIFPPGKSHPGRGTDAQGLEGRKILASLGNRRKPSTVLESDKLGIGGGGE